MKYKLLILVGLVILLHSCNKHDEKNINGPIGVYDIDTLLYNQGNIKEIFYVVNDTFRIKKVSYDSLGNVSYQGIWDTISLTASGKIKIFKDGKLYSQRSFYHGLPDGDMLFYNSAEQLNYKQVYLKGKYIKCEKFENGKRDSLSYWLTFFNSNRDKLKMEGTKILIDNLSYETLFVSKANSLSDSVQIYIEEEGEWVKLRRLNYLFELDREQLSSEMNKFKVLDVVPLSNGNYNTYETYHSYTLE